MLYRTARTVVMTTSASRTTSSTASNYVVLQAPAEEAFIKLEVTALTANSAAALIVTIQQGIRDIDTSVDIVDGMPTTGNIVWDDGFSFTTITTSTAIRYLRLSRTTTSAESAASANAQTSNIQKSSYLGDMFRVGWQLSGAGSTATTFSVIGKFVY